MWTALQKWSVRLSTFIAFLILGRLLSPKEFGIVALASAFIILLTVLADAGFATYLVQARDLTAAKVNTAFYIAAGAGTALAGLLSLLAYPLSAALDVPELRTVLPALSISLIFAGISSVPAALLSRQLKFQAMAMRQVLSTLLSVVVAVLLAFAGAGVWALVAQTLVRQIVSTLVLMSATDFRPQRAFSREDAGVMLAYSLKAMGAQILSQAREQGDALIIGAIAGPVALGLWTVASRLVLVLGDLLGTVVGTVAVPLFARVQHDPQRLGRAISGTASIGTLVLAPALGVLALLSPQLIPHVFGEQWRGATTVATLLALRGVFVALGQLDRSVLLNAGHAGGELRLIAVLTTVHCALVAALATHGVNLLAAVLLVEALLVSPIRPYLIHRWLGVHYRAYAGTVRVTISAVLAGLITDAVLEVFSIDGAAAYGVVVFLGGALYGIFVLILARPVVNETLHALSLLRTRRLRPRGAGAAPSAPPSLSDDLGNEATLATQPLVIPAERYQHLPPAQKATVLTRQLVARQDPDLVVFSSFGGRFSDNPRAVYEELLARSTRHRPVWVAERGIEFPDGLETVRHGTAAYAAAVGRTRLIVSNAAMRHYVKKPGVTYVQTWHGTPLKRIGFDNPRYGHDREGIRRARRDYQRWDYLVSQNRFSTEVFRRAFRFEGEVLEVGYPRNDILRSAEATTVREAVRRSFGVADDVLLVLYAPTFRDDTVDKPAETRLPLELDVLRAALGEHVHVLARLHHRESARLTEPPTDFWTSAGDYPDIRDLYLAADVLVTDYSSSMFDFAVTGKPMVFFTYDLARYRDEIRGFYFDLTEQAPGPVCTTTAEVAEALGDLAGVQRAYSGAYSTFQQTYVPWDDGHAAARILDRVL
jgi:CDP-glycerol glycerophosphotransferase (TagB/SpsB family)/O-antigen/teichoic acid export membrane protein